MYYDRVYYALGILMISGAVIIRTHDGSRVLDLVHRIIIIYQLWNLRIIREQKKENIGPSYRDNAT